MQATVIVALVLHVVSGVFWAGSTFALARSSATQAREFLRPQLGAAAVAIVTGALFTCCMRAKQPLSTLSRQALFSLS
jgi:hypothetical protein